VCQGRGCGHGGQAISTSRACLSYRRLDPKDGKRLRRNWFLRLFLSVAILLHRGQVDGEVICRTYGLRFHFIDTGIEINDHPLTLPGR
jgi:hypothetical protein